MIAVHTRGVVTSENNNIYKNKKAGHQVKNLGRLCATLPLLPSPCFSGCLTACATLPLPPPFFSACLTAVCEPWRRVATKDVCRMNVLGIWLYEGATGVIKGCNLTFNTKSPLKLEKDAGRVEVAKDNKLRDKDA